MNEGKNNIIELYWHTQNILNDYFKFKFNFFLLTKKSQLTDSISLVEKVEKKIEGQNNSKESREIAIQSIQSFIDSYDSYQNTLIMLTIPILTFLIGFSFRHRFNLINIILIISYFFLLLGPFDSKKKKVFLKSLITYLKHIN